MKNKISCSVIYIILTFALSKICTANNYTQPPVEGDHFYSDFYPDL